MWSMDWGYCFIGQKRLPTKRTKQRGGNGHCPVCIYWMEVGISAFGFLIHEAFDALLRGLFKLFEMNFDFRNLAVGR